jgi:hypothetical protein
MASLPRLRWQNSTVNSALAGLPQMMSTRSCE